MRKYFPNIRPLLLNYDSKQISQLDVFLCNELWLTNILRRNPYSLINKPTSIIEIQGYFHIGVLLFDVLQSVFRKLDRFDVVKEMDSTKFSRAAATPGNWEIVWRYSVLL